ncbi:MAG: ABC transporter permease [Actinobacteria bacterium]|nr:ABC transporter permease [Actinomycetota bacterium]
MFSFAARRALSGLLLIVSLTFLTYVVFNTIPTNPACLVVECGPHTTTSDADIRAADHRLGIDRSVFVQYGSFVWKLVRHGSLGTSWTQGRSVRSEITSALPITASLVAGGMVLMLALALALGCFSATRARSVPDRGLLALSVVGLAVHPFVLAIGLRNFFSHSLGLPESRYCPLAAAYGCNGVSSWASHLVVPWIVFALLFLPLYMRMIRARLLETLNEPWIATARAKGASEPRVVLGHALRNAMGPVLPLIAIDAGTALTAAIYIETVFGLPGLGHLAVEAFSGQSGGYDLPLTAGLVTTVGAFVVALNLLADVAGAWLDPRLRLRRKGQMDIALIARRPRVRIGLAVAGTLVIAVGAYALGKSNTNTKVPVSTLKTYPLQFVDAFALPRDTGQGRIRTRVTKFEISAAGWRVYASMTNDSDHPLRITQPHLPPGYSIVYPQEGMSLVVEPSAADRSAGIGYEILAAKSFNPPLPALLQPHQRWAGSFAGDSSVPRNKAMYVAFGSFSRTDDPALQAARPESRLTSQTIEIK